MIIDFFIEFNIIDILRMKGLSIVVLSVPTA